MTEQEIIQNAEKLVNSNEFALFGTITKQKFPNIRAMKVMKREGLKTFYFVTKKDSAKIKEIERRSKGCIYWYDTTTFTFSNLMIEGKLEIIDNTMFGISQFYDMASEPYDFCTIKFKAIKLHYYAPYKKHTIDFK